MATSMFDQSGRLSSADPKVSEAFLKATGGQTLPSSPAAQRAWELAQQRAMQLQQGMAEGRQAVASLKEQQAANPATISGLPSSRVVTSDTGAKAVLDAQGNIVGTNTAVAPVSASVGQFAKERAAFNKGEGTMLEKAALGPNIRDAFLKEYAKPKPVQAVSMEEAPTMAAGAGVRRSSETQAPDLQTLIGKDAYADKPFPFLGGPKQSLANAPILGGDKSVASEMAKAATARETSAKMEAVTAKTKAAEDAIKKAKASGTSTPAEVKKLTEDYAKALSEEEAITLSPEELAAKAGQATNWLGVVDNPGLLGSAGATAKNIGLGVYDAWNNLIDRPYRNLLFGEQGIPDSNAQIRFLAEQENLQRAAGR